MDIDLYIDKIEILIKQMESSEPELRLINFATCVVLLDRIQIIQPENSYIGEKIVQILDLLERICGLANGGRYIANDTSEALFKLEDLKKDFLS